MSVTSELYVLKDDSSEFRVGSEEEVMNALPTFVRRVGIIANQPVDQGVCVGAISFHVHDVTEPESQVHGRVSLDISATLHRVVAKLPTIQDWLLLPREERDDLHPVFREYIEVLESIRHGVSLLVLRSID